jgi:DNA-binding winged helix-turn-helix (wHTH) protein
MAPRLELNFPNPVEGSADLFDRTSQLELIRETVASPARRIAVIMGERVTGKTSLLNVVQAWATAEPGLTVLRLAPVTTRSELMEEILEGMASEADTSLYGLGYRDKAGFTRSTVVGFASVAAQLSVHADRTFIVCLDELDSMLVNCRDGQSATEILDFILYVSNTSLPVRFVFTLTRATPQIMRADATPFITAARIADLTPWTEPETRKFVEWLLSPSSGLVLDDSAHELLFAEGGGHPYLTKAILQPVVDAAGASATGGAISVDQVRAGVAAALAAPEVHLTLDNIVNVHFTPDEVQILQRLATAFEPLAVDDFATTILAFKELRRRHYVRPAQDGFVLASRLLGRWLIGQMSADGDAIGGRGRMNGPGIAKLVLDEIRRRAFLGEHEVQLTQQEYRFLQRLVRELGTVVERAALAAAVWPDESGFEGGRDSRLSQLVHRLRIVLGDDDKDAKYIETRRGFGFSAIPQNVERIRGGE